MKVDVYLNDYFVKYNSAQAKPDKLENLKAGLLQSIYDEDDFYILRGEPAFRSDLQSIVNNITRKNFILTTHGHNPEAIWECRGVPYVSYNWDGFMNDRIKGNTNLTNNIIKSLEAFKRKKTTVRICYTISPHNIKWLETDLQILKQLMHEFPNMKKPYFMIYQQGAYYSQENFSWINFGPQHVEKMNQSGLLTDKNLQYLLSYVGTKNFLCTSVQNEVVVMPDATVRLCNSHKIDTVIGDLKTNNMSEILTSSQQLRDESEHCPFKEKCWMAFHLKENTHVK